MQKNKWHYAWVILIVVALIRGVAGPAINASSGIFLTPVSEELNVGIGQLSLYLSVSSITTMVFLPFAGKLFNQLKVRKILILGVLLQTVAFALLGKMSSVWAWYLFAIPMSMGATLLVNLLGPVLVNRWFKKNVGVVMGLLMMITSLMGALFQPTLTNMIASIGWRNTYFYFGIFALIFMLGVGLIFLKDSPKDIKCSAYGDNVNQTQSTEISGIAYPVAIRSFAFVSLVLFMIVITGFAAFQQHITNLGLQMGLTMVTIGKALSISMIGSAIGSVLIGFSSDRFGIVGTSYGILGIGVLAIALFFIGKNSFPLFVMATFLHGLATSSIGVVAPLLTTKFFGNKDYEKLFSVVMIGSPLASIILMPAYGFIFDAFQNYNLVFVFLIITLIVAGLGLWFGYKSSRSLAK